MKTYGNLVLMATICVVIFWVFMALRPAPAQSTCPQCMGDGFPHPNYQQPVSAPRVQCIRLAVARYRHSTQSLEAAVRACGRYR